MCPRYFYRIGFPLHTSRFLLAESILGVSHNLYILELGVAILPSAICPPVSDLALSVSGICCSGCGSVWSRCRGAVTNPKPPRHRRRSSSPDAARRSLPGRTTAAQWLTSEVANVRDPGSNLDDRSPILLPRTKKEGKISSIPAATSTSPSDNYTGRGPTTTTITPVQYIYYA